MKNKQLSVIIPAYNCEQYIEECLKSLSDLSISDMEIIVVDDGSTDRTAEIVDMYSKQDTRIILVSVPNGGVSRARNTGVSHSSGEYLMFLDADDYLQKEALDRIQRALESDACDFSAFARTIIEEDGRAWDDLFPISDIESLRKDDSDMIMFADSMFNECWGKIFRKSIIDEFGIIFPVDIPIGEDLMFVMEYYSHCKSFHIYNIPLVAYRQHGTSAMRKYTVDDRLGYTQNLYKYSQKYIPENMREKALFYNFKIITNLCREYSEDAINPDTIRKIYASVMVSDIMNEIKISMIPLYRKHEYFLMKKKLFFMSAVYYHVKAKLK